jgi:hypothetical protein
MLNMIVIDVPWPYTVAVWVIALAAVAWVVLSIVKYRDQQKWLRNAEKHPDRPFVTMPMPKGERPGDFLSSAETVPHKATPKSLVRLKGEAKEREQVHQWRVQQFWKHQQMNGGK